MTEHGMDRLGNCLIAIAIGLLIATLVIAQGHIREHEEHMKAHDRMDAMLHILPPMMNAVTEKVNRLLAIDKYIDEKGVAGL